MVWATLGPVNEPFHEAMRDTGPVIEWATQCCERKNLDPDGLGMQMFYAADRGGHHGHDARDRDPRVLPVSRPVPDAARAG